MIEQMGPKTIDHLLHASFVLSNFSNEEATDGWNHIKSACRKWFRNIDSSTAPSVTAVDRVSITEVR